MTLVIVVLITVVTVGYLASVMLESKTAGAGLDQERAYGIAMIGVHEAMSRVRDALGPWDDPYKNFATNPPAFYWSLSPGRVTRWSYSSVNPQTNFALFSESTGTSLVNLNRALADGSHPIIEGANPPDVSVKWANVLPDPSKPAGAANAIIGRYAFWVDDEGAKININTADGTEKYTTNSLGIGAPSEVSLETLFATNGRTASKEIVQFARTNGFHSPQEILTATNVTPGAYTTNVFAITTYSRSPDLNVFGQPKMALLPIIGGANEWATNMTLNGITLRPPTEIYPTPSQLPGYTVTNRYYDETNIRSWPLAFRQNRTDFTTGRNNGDWYSIRETATRLDNYCYVNGWMLANYLAGTNAAGKPLEWPAFRGPSGAALTDGFAGKYTPRQIDNIVAQIVSLGSKAISSDFTHNSGDADMEQRGLRYNVSPNLFPGWLSDEVVIGMGRSMKLTSMLVKVSAYGAQTNVTPPVPKAHVDIWLEWWIPGAYRGGEPVLKVNGAAMIFNGHRGFKGVLNEKDHCTSFDHGEPVAAPPNYNYLAAPLPRTDNVTRNYWADQMLHNNQGIDFAANPTNRYDPDQLRAAIFHDPWAKDPNPPNEKYMGAGSADTSAGDLKDTPFRMHDLQSHAPTNEWQPGEMRSNKNRVAASVRYPMKEGAAGSLVIGGGISVRSQIRDGKMSDPDPVPLEGVRGPFRKNAQNETNEPLKGADYVSPDWYARPEYWALNAVPGRPPMGNLRQRIIDSVIPVSLAVDIPPPESLTANVKYVLVTPKGKDPLVNKFPGDWQLQEVGGPPPQFLVTYSGEDVSFNPDKETALLASMRAANVDADSYWMPQADCAFTQCEPTPTADLARQTLIFRSARMPNIGYLQYLRTGIIPDDEEKPYTAQEGVPFRLLSFAPSWEPSSANPLVGQKTTRGASKAYPDWALLDLLYIPSMLNSYGPGTNGGPYNALTNLSYFGTFGGSTAGRINPNGAVIYTTDVNTPLSGVSRTTSLEAVLKGVMVNQTFNGTADKPEVWPYTGGAEVDAAAVAKAIETYIRTNGPLRMPSEICNVPEVAEQRAAVNPTRNDLVRQIMGNLTTQGNVFSIWTVGQSLVKRTGNANYGEFEAGDTVLAEVRLRFVVERYLDPGADGVYGNSTQRGDDGIAGTYDDPMDPTNHPFQPKYLYRVIASEEVR
jgi:hypothetical protein